MLSSTLGRAGKSAARAAGARAPITSAASTPTTTPASTSSSSSATTRPQSFSTSVSAPVLPSPSAPPRHPLQAATAPNQPLAESNLPVDSYFGMNVFDRRTMKKYLSQSENDKFHTALASNKPIDFGTADAVANALLRWATERGATHFTHWFQPITGTCAEKHDTFLDTLRDGETPLVRFTGKQLIMGEPDGSSFPSGGLRATHIARGYTAWDPHSPPFVLHNGNGATLMIPSCFFSWDKSYALDEKIPLLRSEVALSRESMHLFKVLGESRHTRVHMDAGLEQEFFLIDRKYFLERPDLMVTGRTVIGAQPPKGQELEDQYFAPISSRMLDCMHDLEVQCWKLGIPIQTRHREVAPGQYECLLRGTLVVCADGTTKSAEKVRAGELLLGQHGLPVEVAHVQTDELGRKLVYDVRTSAGAYAVTAEHRLPVSVRRNPTIRLGPTAEEDEDNASWTLEARWWSWDGDGVPQMQSRQLTCQPPSDLAAAAAAAAGPIEFEVRLDVLQAREADAREMKAYQRAERGVDGATDEAATSELDEISLAAAYSAAGVAFDGVSASIARAHAAAETSLPLVGTRAQLLTVGLEWLSAARRASSSKTAFIGIPVLALGDVVDLKVADLMDDVNWSRMQMDGEARVVRGVALRHPTDGLAPPTTTAAGLMTPSDSLSACRAGMRSVLKQQVSAHVALGCYAHHRWLSDAAGPGALLDDADLHVESATLEVVGGVQRLRIVCQVDAEPHVCLVYLAPNPGHAQRARELEAIVRMASGLAPAADADDDEATRKLRRAAEDDLLPIFTGQPSLRPGGAQSVVNISIKAARESDKRYVLVSSTGRAVVTHNCVPKFAPANVGTDRNLLLMELLKRISRKHGLTALLHEKPFAGVNGSGKHNNWSLGTNDVPSLLDPGLHPEKNARFMLFLAATLRAVDLHADLMRVAISGVGNDHRLGANEAPPAIVSAYLGDDIEQALERFVSESPTASSFDTKIHLGIHTLPDLKRVPTDRNRTSTFAFTGNKFEFRAVGSSHNPARSNTVLNTIVAESVRFFADEVERLKATGLTTEVALKRVTQAALAQHKRIIFNGNGYSEEWALEAARRGLPNLKTTPQALDTFYSEKNISLFERMKVLTREELQSRSQILFEDYTKRILIEGKVMASMCLTQIAPVAFQEQMKIARSIQAMEQVAGVGSAGQHQRGVLTALTASLDQLIEGAEAVKKVCAAAHDQGSPAASAHYCEQRLIPLMAQTRAAADRLETMINAKDWPLPTYHQMMFVGQD